MPDVKATDENGVTRVTLGAVTAAVTAGGGGAAGSVVLVNGAGAPLVLIRSGAPGSTNAPPVPLIVTERLTLDGEKAEVTIGGPGAAGYCAVTDGSQSRVVLEGGLGALMLKSSHGLPTVILRSETAEAEVGVAGKSGKILVNSSSGQPTITLDGQTGEVHLGKQSNAGRLVVYDGKPLESIVVDGTQHRIIIYDKGGVPAVTLDGGTGDILLGNGDCAEDFDVAAACETGIEPGTVVVLDEAGAIAPCLAAYDGRVAGVVSGAGSYRPALILDRRPSARLRLPVALLGKVFCRAEAETEAIRPGDLVTTSDIVGHARKASDRARAFGAVLGKALAPLSHGRGLIPLLVALR